MSRHLVVAVSLVFFVGCGPSGPPTAELSGKVVFQGKPVAEGTVSLRSEVGTGGEANLQEDGTFTIKDLPVGEYRALILPLVMLQKEGPRGYEVSVEKPAPNIPLKYRTIGATDLRVAVKEGKNEVRFELAP